MINETLKIFFDFGFNYLPATESVGKITKKELAKSSVYVDYIYLRYVITLVFPPIGIFLSKGIKYGWVNILIASFLCYLNYFIAIIYAFVITFNNKYADLYIQSERNKLQKFKKELKEEDNIDLDKRRSNLLAILVILVILLFVIFSVLKLFNKSKMN